MTRWYGKTFCSLAMCAYLQLAGCGGEDDKGSGSSNEHLTSGSTNEPINNGGDADFASLGLEIVDDETWDDGAVRQVLDIFAYGGHATDSQINYWAEMRPDQAIVEMLTFEQHNLLLSPPASSDHDKLYLRDGTLRGLGEFWSSDDEHNGVHEDHRDRYVPVIGIKNIWLRAAVSRGLNPFRQKIGLWETNYHLAANLDNNVFKGQMLRYYDDIMEAHASGLPYQEVLSIAATSAAIASQYGHWSNRYKDNVCLCNEDFAREYYQLFFGILGENAPDHHETVTIKNTALALTGIRFQKTPDGRRGDGLLFTSEYHYPGELEMLGVSYWGENALERIEQVSRDAINHPESLDNLPVMIVGGIADDNLDGYKIAKLRHAWASMQEKNLLTFLRAYAVSTLFHNSDRIKYLSSIDRQIKTANSIILSNEEAYLVLDRVLSIEGEGVRVFHPTHNVFGNQTGLEAYNSADVFRHNYNRVTAKSHTFRMSEAGNLGGSWTKDWGANIPANADGDYLVKEVAEWLWIRFVGDELKNLGSLERAHIYAFLSSGEDLASLVSPEQPDIVITTSDLQADPDLSMLIEDLGGISMLLGSKDKDERRYANELVGQAINFIVGTPYMFVNEGADT
jgi:hypothetical protein